MAWPRRTPLAAVPQAVTALGLTVGLIVANDASAQGKPPVLAGVDAGQHPVTVAPGDTLIGLARRFFLEPGAWREMLHFNKVRDPNVIKPGQVIQLPWYLMPARQLKATVLSARGNVSDGGAGAVRDGHTLGEGERLQMRGEDAEAVVKLVDGTVLRLRGPAALGIERSREVANTGSRPSQVRLDEGRVDVLAAPAQRGRPGFHVNTPQGVLAVRGTEFRVSVDAARTLGEVLEGEVQVASGGATQGVGAGYGTALVRGSAPAAPVALPGAPDVRGLPVLHENLVVRFAPAPVPGARGWRAQLQAASAAAAPLAELRVASGELRFAGLDDGDYVLKLRAVDSQGLEGRDATHRFRLKARPEAPLQTAPAPAAKLAGGRADLVWTEQPQAARYRVQLAADAAFSRLIREWPAVHATQLAADGLPPGAYHWRVGSLRDVAGKEDRGPWGTARAFEMRALPAAPALHPAAVGDSGVRLAWTLEPGQVAQVQLAADTGFADLRLDQRVSATQYELPLPPPGRWYLRVRAVDADGFAGPFGVAQSFEVHACWRDASGACIRSSDNQVLRLQ